VEVTEALQLLGLTQGFSRAELDRAAKDIAELAQANRQTQLIANVGKARKVLLSLAAPDVLVGEDEPASK